MDARSESGSPSRGLWRTIREIHLWLTLTLGLPIVVIAAAGLPLTYWYEADAILDPAFYATDEHVGPRASLDELVASARTVPGVTAVAVDVARGTVLVEGQADDALVRDAIVEAGYEVG